VRGVRLDLGHVLQERVEARAADYTDLCIRHGQHSIRLRLDAAGGSGNAKNPAVLRRQGPVSESYAAELLLEEVPVPDDFESEDDEDEGVEVDVDGLDAGELLDEEPRLSLR